MYELVVLASFSAFGDCDLRLSENTSGGRSMKSFDSPGNGVLSMFAWTLTVPSSLGHSGPSP